MTIIQQLLEGNRRVSPPDPYQRVFRALVKTEPKWDVVRCSDGIYRIEHPDKFCAAPEKVPGEKRSRIVVKQEDVDALGI